MTSPERNSRRPRFFGKLHKLPHAGAPVEIDDNGGRIVHVITRMRSYSQTSQPIKPQRSPESEIARSVHPEGYRSLANYLATVNLSSASNQEYSFKTLPRPTGRSTHVIITEYDLPRKTIMPHDVIVDERGTAWYSDFGEQYFGSLIRRPAKSPSGQCPSQNPTFPRACSTWKKPRTEQCGSA